MIGLTVQILYSALLPPLAVGLGGRALRINPAQPVGLVAAEFLEVMILRCRVEQEILLAFRHLKEMRAVILFQLVAAAAVLVVQVRMPLLEVVPLIL
jgi:hypothetical protein